MHLQKSKYMVVNPADRAPCVVEGIQISHTERYVYLGVPISIGPIHQQLADHIRSKQGHIIKYQAFVHWNIFASFTVKTTVLDSAVQSALLYSSES